MKLTTRSKYGLRAVYYLKQHYDKGPVSLPSLVTDLKLSQNYLEQLFIKLKKSNIVISKRGKYGGYILAKKPEHITIGQVIRALEGTIDYSSECNDHENCDMIDCITRHVFIKIDIAVNNVIDNMTLDEL